MPFNWQAPGIVWLEDTAESAVVAAAAVAWSLTTPGAQTHSSWAAIALLSAKAALGAVLYAIVTLKRKNGTASFNPRVVAAPRKPDA